MSKLESLLIEIFEVKEEKNIVIKSQQYERAAHLRDRERILERDFYILLNGEDSKYDWKKYEDCVDKYCVVTSE